MIELVWNLFDGLLAGLALVLAWVALSGADQRQGVIFYIAFALVIALIWARLNAPDVALAEAAIGAGLSGALLLAAADDSPGTGERAPSPRWIRGLNLLIDGLCVALAAVVTWAYISAFAGTDAVRLHGMVMENLDNSGVGNPVTAVLLNFRAYDTLLELTVLLTALLGIVALAPARPAYAAPGAVFIGLVHWLVPALMITGAYLLWAGSHAPGGAFQAGALLAAAGVLLRLAGQGQAGLPTGVLLRVSVAAGVGMFSAAGLLMPLLGGVFLEYPPALAGGLILLIETAAMLSIAAILIIAFLGGRPEHWQSAGPGQERRP